MDFHVTLFFVGLLAVLQVPATFFVILHRLKTKVVISDGGNPALLRRIRAHGNFTETVPITLIAMAAADYSGAGDAFLWVAGGGLVVGRIAHFFSVALTDGPSVMRVLGMVLTLSAMLTFGGYALTQNWPL